MFRRDLRRDPPSLLTAVALLLVGLVVMVVGWRLVDEYRALAEASTLARWITPSASSRPSASDGGRTLTILGAGDIIVHPQVLQQAAADARAAGRSGYDFFPMFQAISPTVSAADLAICHLDTTIGPGQPSGPPAFRAPPQLAQAVKRAGFDACSTASSNTLARGTVGVTSTIEALEAAGLGHTGSYRSAEESATPTLYAVRGVMVGHLSYTVDFNGAKRPAGKEWIANLADPAKITAAARAARAAGAEIVVLSLHWGTEFRHAPDAVQQRWARDLIALPDIDLILGHHSHVVQPFERVGGEWVVYGMGNDLARHPDAINDTREGVLARITFTEIGPQRWRAARIEAVPTWTDLSPKLRLVDLPAVLADTAIPANLRATYQAAYDRVKIHVLSRGGGPAGLVVAEPAR